MSLVSDELKSMDGWLVSELAKLVKDEHDYERVMAEARQQRAARVLGQDRKSIDGLGRPRLEVDSYAYHFWGQKVGYEAWKDPQFLREFERDNEHCRVKAKGTRIQSGYGGLASGCKTTFKKTYG